MTQWLMYWIISVFSVMLWTAVTSGPWYLWSEVLHLLSCHVHLVVCCYTLIKLHKVNCDMERQGRQWEEKSNSLCLMHNNIGITRSYTTIINVLWPFSVHDNSETEKDMLQSVKASYTCVHACVCFSEDVPDAATCKLKVGRVSFYCLVSPIIRLKESV